jgi:2-hydroxychromene-2-carboxylate isomerase
LSTVVRPFLCILAAHPGILTKRFSSVEPDNSRGTGQDRIVSPADLEFWFEFGSTYSYLSAVRIEELAAAAGVSVLWEPFLLGPIFAEQGWDDSPFNIYPVKGLYMWRDVERLCAKYRIPFSKPSRFPRSGLLAARVACLARARSEDWLPDFVRGVFRANFAEDRETGDVAEVCSILDSLGQPLESLLEGCHLDLAYDLAGRVGCPLVLDELSKLGGFLSRA